MGNSPFCVVYYTAVFIWSNITAFSFSSIRLLPSQTVVEGAFFKNHLNHPHPLARGEPPAPKNHVKRAGIVNPPTNSTPWLRLLLRLIRSLRSRILRSSSKREPPATSAKGSCARGNSDERLRTRRQGGGFRWTIQAHHAHIIRMVQVLNPWSLWLQRQEGVGHTSLLCGSQSSTKMSVWSEFPPL